MAPPESDAFEDTNVDELNRYELDTWLKRLRLDIIRGEMVQSKKIRIKQALQWWGERYSYQHKQAFFSIGGKYRGVDTSVHYRLYREFQHRQFVIKLASGIALGKIPCYFVSNVVGGAAYCWCCD